MKLYEIDGRDITAYKLAVRNDKEVTGNFSKDYKSLNNDYLQFKSRYHDINRISRRDKIIATGHLMNRITHIDNICVDVINADNDNDAIQIKSRLDKIYQDLDIMRASIV